MLASSLFSRLKMIKYDLTNKIQEKNSRNRNSKKVKIIKADLSFVNSFYMWVLVPPLGVAKCVMSPHMSDDCVTLQSSECCVPPSKWQIWPAHPQNIPIVQWLWNSWHEWALSYIWQSGQMRKCDAMLQRIWQDKMTSHDSQPKHLFHNASSNLK